MQKIYIGWDPRETLAYKVAKESIIKRNASNIPIEALSLDSVKHILSRPIEKKNDKMWCPISKAPMATEFAISRFAIPFLQTSGWGLFLDCDMVILADIQELFNQADNKYAVMVVKHKELTAEGTKMDGQIQTVYPKKNWSSVVLWNLDHPANRKLTLAILNTFAGRDLHAFSWLKDEEIGELSPEWNYLVGVNPPMKNPKIAHYTLGGPWIKGWVPKESDEIWNNELSYLEKTEK